MFLNTIITTGQSTCRIQHHNIGGEGRMEDLYIVQFVFQLYIK